LERPADNREVMSPNLIGPISFISMHLLLGPPGPTRFSFKEKILYPAPRSPSSVCMETKGVRLQKFLADAGVASRRAAEKLILAGEVRVNGAVVRELGTRVAPDDDDVTVNGNPVGRRERKVYIVLNKPPGYVTSTSDHRGRPTVMELVGRVSQRVYPVGRLDMNSEGLLVMTNDGELAQAIMHPRNRVAKTYEAKVRGRVDGEVVARLARGVRHKRDFLRPECVRLLRPLAGGAWLVFVLVEGKYREVRRLCAAAGLQVQRLRRVAIGGMALGGLQPGEYELLTREELARRLGLR
jgi:pseudouridine synthase